MEEFFHLVSQYSLSTRILLAIFVLVGAAMLHGLAVRLLLVLGEKRRLETPKPENSSWYFFAYIIQSLYLKFQRLTLIALGVIWWLLCAAAVLMLISAPKEIVLDTPRGPIKIFNIALLQINFFGDLKVSETSFGARSPSGGHAEVAIDTVDTGGAFWPLNMDDIPNWRMVDPYFRDKDVLMKLKNAQAVTCVGLASNLDTGGSEEHETDLSRRRAIRLCLHVSRILGNPATPIFYSFGLGRDMVYSSSVESPADDAQRPLVIVRVSNTTKELREEGPRKELIEKILRSKGRLGFFPKAYLVLATRGQRLCWYQLGGGENADTGCPEVSEFNLK